MIPLCRGLAKLLIVDVALNRGQDNPQLIFESMNSTGKALSQADLVRNFILMGLEPEHQTRLYEDHWRPMEVAFGQQGYSEYFDSFMRHYLTVKTGEIPRTDEVYEAFKLHARSQSVAEKGVDRLVEDIHIYAEYYCAMALGKESDKSLATAFQDLRELKVDVAYPFLLALYHDYKNGVLSHEDFLSIIRLIESYVFRRAVCAIPTNSLNKTFATFYKVINKEKYLESIQVHFLNIEDGFKHSPLYLNIGLGQCEKWDEAAIHARADRLAELAVQVWQAPSLPEEVLAVYRGQPENKTSYSLSDYPFLADGLHSRLLFDHLRDEIMRLDAGITQEVLKLYIAFKAETNFVDVVPQKSRLRLSLNMQFHELVDPKGIAKDVTNVGRWGNGDVEIGFSDLAQLPYIMGLIRQAFEKQMESALV